MERLGKKVYTSATLAFSAMNYQTHMAKYSLALMADASKFISELPDIANKAKISNILRFGSQVTRQSIKCSYEAVEASARAPASRSVLKRYSWLRLQPLLDDIAAKLMEAPIDNKGPLWFCSCKAFQSLLGKEE